MPATSADRSTAVNSGMNSAPRRRRARRQHLHCTCDEIGLHSPAVSSTFTITSVEHRRHVTTAQIEVGSRATHSGAPPVRATTHAPRESAVNARTRRCQRSKVSESLPSRSSDAVGNHGDMLPPQSIQLTPNRPDGSGASVQPGAAIRSEAIPARKAGRPVTADRRPGRKEPDSAPRVPWVGGRPDRGGNPVGSAGCRRAIGR
jgi:hypothetical protein